VIGAALGAPLDAQCNGIPDGFTGPCWDPVTPNRPAGVGEGFTIEAGGICWKECAPVEQVPLQVDLGVSNPGMCGTSFSLRVTDSTSGAIILSGASGFMEYTRTWGETTAAGALYQVHRFLLRIDLSPIKGATSCPVPACVHPGAFPISYFYGYVDYAVPCLSKAAPDDHQLIEHSLVLFHNIDGFIHPPIWSALPGAFHKESTYAIVGPDTAAQPFIPANAPHPAGSMSAEAVRTIVSPAGLPACIAEERVAQSSLSLPITGCSCPLDLSIPSLSLSPWSGIGSCPVPSLWAAFNFWPTLPWYDLVSTSLGTWSDPDSYPGREHVWANEGLFGYIDGCYTGADVHDTFFEVMYGATTAGGLQIVPGINFWSSDILIDMGSNYSTPSNAMPIPLPFVGFAVPGRHLIYGNLVSH
jgi:hypothetical protein